MNVAALSSALAAVCPIDGVAGPIVPPSPWILYPAKDGSQWRIDFDASATAAQRQAAIAALAAYDTTAAAPREVAVSDLLDALSTTQRGTITTDHVNRLLARGGKGTVTASDPKVIRAAGDIGIAPAAWVALVPGG